MGQTRGSPTVDPRTPFGFARTDHGNPRLGTDRAGIAAFALRDRGDLVAKAGKLLWITQYEPTIGRATDTFDDARVGHGARADPNRNRTLYR